MGALKNAFHDEICAAADDKRHDEFDCYEAQLHAVLANLDWLMRQQIPGPTRACVEYIRRDIEEMMK